jgi:uncharacterized protein (TIGR02145 family)
MKKHLSYLISAAIALSLAFVACDKDNNSNDDENNGTTSTIPVTHVALSQTSATLGIGNTLTLTETVLPDSATNKNVTWSSSNTNVATVNNGVVTALSVGSTNIVVTTQNENKKDTCFVTVVPAVVSVESVTLNQTIAALTVGDRFMLTATVLPSNAANKTVTWSSSNTTVASVVNGTITALSAGSTNITVVTADGNKTATCGVIVAVLPPPAVPTTCNQNNPGWGSSLGTVTRGSERTISGNGITQIWSGAVTATNCNKTTFTGSTNSTWNADCRSNPGYPGDLFSFCAVVRFAATLCPSPWRVPTGQDFINLDIALGGQGETNRSAGKTTYVDRWGASFGGSYSIANRRMQGQGQVGNYWAQTTRSNDVRQMEHLHISNFDFVGFVIPLRTFNQNDGFTLRCVR